MKDGQILLRRSLYAKEAAHVAASPEKNACSSGAYANSILPVAGSMSLTIASDCRS